MTEPGEPASVRPWSPYPVQDWSTLPYDPLAPVDPVHYTGVDPGWGAPAGDRSRRPGWVPLVVTLLVLALVSGGIYVANLIGTPGADRGAARFAPTDGVVGSHNQLTANNGTDVNTTVITEQARYLGLTGLQSLDWTVSSQVLGSLTQPLESMHFWRSLSTTVGSTAGTGQTMTMREVGDAISLVAQTGPTISYVYSPALVELPADVEPGSRWSSSGTAGPELRYASAFTAEAAEHGCLQVSGTITYGPADGSTARTVTLDRTWCVGAGIATEQVVEGGTTTTVRPRADLAPAAPPGAEASYTWSDPAGWRRHDFAAVTIDPTFGQGIVGGTPSAVPPVSTSSGIVFRVNQQARDIVGFVPKSTTTWRQAVRMHPGGTIVTLAAFGRIVVATTSGREVVAYDDQGARLWQLGLGELAVRPPVRLDPTTVALATIAGEVIVVDLSSGAIRWQQFVGSEVANPLAAGNGVIVVLDRAGNATALEQADGKTRWQVELQSSGVAIGGDLLVGITDQSLEGVDVADGQRRWLRPFRGTFEQVSAFAGHFVVRTQLATLAVDHAGVVATIGPPYRSSMQTIDYYLGWADGHTDVIDSSLARVGGWPDEAETLGTFATSGLPYAQGVVVVTGRDWSIQTHSDEP